MTQANEQFIRKEHIAYHEAGHAVMYYLLHLPFKEVSIIPDGDRLGHVQSGEPPKSFRPGIDTSLKTRERIEREIMARLAGSVTEEILAGKISQGGGQDWHTAFGIAQCIVGSDEEAEAYIGWLWVRTRNILQMDFNWIAVQAVAQALLQEGRLSQYKTRRIIKESRENYIEESIQRGKHGR